MLHEYVHAFPFQKYIECGGVPYFVYISPINVLNIYDLPSISLAKAECPLNLCFVGHANARLRLSKIETTILDSHIAEQLFFITLRTKDRPVQGFLDLEIYANIFCIIEA